jgi:NCAIR mutase (PurE)-related protein
VDRAQLLQLLEAVRAGETAPAAAARTIAALPESATIEGAVIDHQRELRTGVPELVYGASKTAAQIAATLTELARQGGAIATRVDADKAAAVQALVPAARHDAMSRIVSLGERPARPACAPIVVVCAGTSDLPVAEEAAQVAEWLGAPVTRIIDVGVAGLHRLLARVPDIRAGDVVIAVAGMEAALPSVLGGLIDRPMIAVPTSVGYGVSLDGLIALGALLSSCAPGCTVVNIDNGVGAAVAAVKIGRLIVR